MGEYAKFNGQDIKIGTCEDLYYLRADQAGLVTKVPNSLDPSDPQIQSVLRFRFPWPDEDGIEPGAFEPYSRELKVFGATVPGDIDHSNLQFRHDAGYLVSLPCPESDESIQAAPYKVHRNGFDGALSIVQQGYRNGVLATICKCVCGAKWAVPVEDVPALVAAIDNKDIAERIEAGYRAPTAAEVKCGRCAVSYRPSRYSSNCPHPDMSPEAIRSLMAHRGGA